MNVEKINVCVCVWGGGGGGMQSSVYKSSIVDHYKSRPNIMESSSSSKIITKSKSTASTHSDAQMCPRIWSASAPMYSQVCSRVLWN